MTPQLFFIYVITFILAGCSILYELVIAQTMSVLAANTVGRYSLTIGIYLGTMGVGALLCNKIFRKKQGWSALFSVEIILSIAGSISVGIVYFAHIICSYIYDYNNAAMAFFIPSFFIVAAVGFFSGLELPLLITIGNRVSAQKKITNRILGVDYLGSLAGAILFPLFLLPHFEVLTISLITALLNLIAALAILLMYLKDRRGFIFKLCFIVLPLSLIITCFVTIKDIHQYFLKKYYFYIEASENLSTLIRPMTTFPEIERFSSLYQKIDIVKSLPYEDPYSSLLAEAYSTKYRDDPDFPRDYYLYLNGEYQISTDYEEIYHEYFVHVPIILNNRIPEKVLVLGGGDGLVNRELLKYPEVRNIIHVELDKKMIEVAKTHPVLRYINKGALENPRVEITIADAYQYIKNTDEQFDAIYIDIPYPVDYNLSKLFSREFYHFVKRRLYKNGFAVIDAPGSDRFIYDHRSHQMMLEDDNDWEIYYNTLKAAGFGTILPFVSNLESDNPEVHTIFTKAASTNPDIDLKKVTSEMMNHIRDLQKGFIMVKSDKEDINIYNREYKKPEIKLNVLNEKRFYLAFDLLSAYSWERKEEKVNSIMKPTFPSLSFWDIRLP